MSPVPADIQRAMLSRSGEQVWLTILSPGEVTDFDALSTMAGLRALGSQWHLLERPRAREQLAWILHEDLAYSAELMPRDGAELLAEQFLACFDSPGTRYASNTEGPFWASSSGSWNPLTDYTFDSGVAVIGARGAALYWVADED